MEPVSYTHLDVYKRQIFCKIASKLQFVLKIALSKTHKSYFLSLFLKIFEKNSQNFHKIVLAIKLRYNTLCLKILFILKPFQRLFSCCLQCGWDFFYSILALQKIVMALLYLSLIHIQMCIRDRSLYRPMFCRIYYSCLLYTSRCV